MRSTKMFVLECLSVLALMTMAGNTAVFAQTPAIQPVDVVLALDNSGSMKVNDPHGLVREAVASFAGRLRSDSQVGVVLFDQRVELILGLTGVSDPTFKGRLSEALQRLDYSGKWTDIPGGIERAMYALNHDGRPGSRRAVVFFTDGIIETGDHAKDIESGRWLRENLAAEARDRDIRVFGVAFTESADYELIQSVAQLTGGEHYRVLKPADIEDAFGGISRLLLAPAAVSVPKPAPVAPASPPESSGVARWSLVVVALIASVVILVVVLLRRRSSSGGDPGLLDLPKSDFAHLIDIGRNSGAERVPIEKRRVRIGRDKILNDVCIPESTVTSQHAVIEYRDGSFFLRDLRSSNGTFVNGKKMSDPDSIREVNLKPGDRIRFDAFEFVFDLDALSRDVDAGGGNVPQRKKTVLRGDPALRAQAAKEGAPAPNAPQPPAPTVQKVADKTKAPAATKVRDEFCSAHPARTATELCPKCGIGKCKACMTEKDGSPICIQCGGADQKMA